VIRNRHAAACVAALLVFTAERAASQGRWIGTGGLGYVEQRVDAGYGLEQFSGLALEFGVDGRLSSHVAITLRGLGGELQAADAADLDRRIGEAEVLARYKLASVWGFYGGVTLRAISSDAGRQHWVVGRIGAEVRPAFSGGRLHAIGRIGLIPVAAIEGLSSAAITLDGAVGLEYERDRISLGLVYAVEQYAFTAPGDIERAEQLSRLMLRGGLRL